jgi:cell division protein FtsX
MRSQLGSTAVQNQYTAALQQPAPTAPKPQAVQLPRRQTQNLWLLLIMTSALFCAAVGILYLSSYASLASEAYRRVHLRAQLQAEMDKSTQYQQVMARVKATETIEHKAQQLGMVPAKSRDAFIVGQSR